MARVINVTGRQTRAIRLTGEKDVVIRFAPGATLDVPGQNHAIHIERCNRVRVEGNNLNTIKSFIGIWIGNTNGDWEDIVVNGVSVIGCRQQGILGVNAQGVLLNNVTSRNVAVQHAVYFGNINRGITKKIRLKGCHLGHTALACLQFNAESAAAKCGPCEVIDTVIDNNFALNLLSVDPILFQRCTINGTTHVDHTFGRNWPTRAVYDNVTKFSRRPNEMNGSTFKQGGRSTGVEAHDAVTTEE